MKKIQYIIITILCYSIRYSQTAEEYFKKGNENYESGDYINAIKNYTKSIKLDSQKSNYFEYRAFAKFSLKDNNGGIKDLDKAIEIESEPNNMGHYYMNRAHGKTYLKNYIGAIYDFNKTIELSPNDPLTYYYRGRCKNSLGDYRGAILDFDKSIELEANYPEMDKKSIYFDRAISKLNQKESACQDLSKSGELGNEEAYEMIKKNCN